MTQEFREPADLTAQPADAIHIPCKSLRRYAYVILSVLTAVSGVYIMFDILRANDLTTLEAVILLLFGISFTWLALAFWSGLFGFIL